MKHFAIDKNATFAVLLLLPKKVKIKYNVVSLFYRLKKTIALMATKAIPKVVTKEDIQAAETQIYDKSDNIRYDIRELTIEILIDKYEKGLEYSEYRGDKFEYKHYNILFIPEYQREFTWSEEKQAKLIESILLGLPIPLIFVAENRSSAWEIVDGSQRIRALYRFVKNELCLNNLEKIDKLNGFYFKDLDRRRQGKFLAIALRMIVLSEEVTEDNKQDMFERINRGSELLRPIQLRKNMRGDFTHFIFAIANAQSIQDKHPQWENLRQLFEKLTPLGNWEIKRSERAELALRFFALKECYGKKTTKQEIQIYLDTFLKDKNEAIKDNPSLKKTFLQAAHDDFLKVLQFVEAHTEFGFRENNRKRTKRGAFEALAVATHFALKEQPSLNVPNDFIVEILRSPDFNKTWEGNAQVVYALDSCEKRITFIKDKLLKS
ncbi:MAG: hypothetical protein RL329_2482 [Bacteroidota bacterium]